VRGLRVALWMADECHRGNTAAVRATVERMRPVTRIGLTATPYTRVVGDALIGWERLVYGYTIDRAVEEGVLVPARYITWDGADDLPAVEMTIAMIRRHAPDGPGIVSAPSCADADALAEALRAEGIAAAAIHTKVPGGAKARAALIERLRTGALRCLVHVDLLTEGVDLPWLTWLAMHRPRGSAVAIVQEVGRVLRSHPGKADAVVLLPHLTPVLHSIARAAELEPDAVERARIMREAAERELQDLDTPLPLGVSVGDVDGWIAALLSRCAEDGITIPESQVVQRGMAPTSEQVRILGELAVGHSSPIRYVESTQRDPLRAAIQHPEVLTRGAASDLIALCSALRRRAGEVKRTTGEWWKGLRGGQWPEPPALGKPKRAA
jgi:superfamily II DNA or RNA helicase